MEIYTKHPERMKITNNKLIDESRNNNDTKNARTFTKKFCSRMQTTCSGG